MNEDGAFHMRILAIMLLAAMLGGCMSSGVQGEMPDPAARGGGLAGNAPGGSPYEPSTR